MSHLQELLLKDLYGLMNQKAFAFAAEDRIYGDEEFANELNFSTQVIKILEESNKLTANSEVIFQRKDKNSYSDSLNFPIFSDNLSLEELIKYKEKFEKNPVLAKKLEELDWENICVNKKMSENFIRVFQDYLNWADISYFTPKFSKEFMAEFKDKINWDSYFESHTVPEEVIRTDLMDIIKTKQSLINVIIFYQKISPELFDEFAQIKKINPNEFINYIVKNNNTITEDFFIKYADLVPDLFWQNISKTPRKLSTNFLRTFKDKLNWNEISTNQVLNLDQIKEFKDKINFYRLLHSRNWAQGMIYNIKEIEKTVKK